MRTSMSIATSVCLISGWAGAFGPATHAYLAMNATGTNHSDVVWGAMAPDFAQMAQGDNPAAAGALSGMTHTEFNRLAASCFAIGFSTHNGTWGADYYAHRVFTPEAEPIFSSTIIRQLSQEFSIPIARGEDLFEAAMDYLVRIEYGPGLGAIMERSAEASGAQNEQAVVDAFASELTARTSGLALADAQQLIRNAFRAYIQATKVFGGQLKGDVNAVKQSIMPILASYLNVSLATAGTYFDRAVELCSAGYQAELTRIVGNMTGQLQTGDCPSVEGEDEGEGEEETPVDFCAILGYVSTNPLLGAVGAQYRDLIALLSPDIADLNGPFTVDLVNPVNYTITVQGNQMLDGANELGLLARILNDKHFANGVLTHDQVHAAWQHNYTQLFNVNVGMALAPTLSSMVPGLVEMLVGYVTLGDGELTSSAYMTVSGSGSFGFVAGLFSLLDNALVSRLGAGFANPELVKGDFILLPMLAADGDADVDGFTNSQEYAYFSPRACGSSDKSAASVDYVTAALNPAVCPDCQPCPDCLPTTRRLFELGDDVCLTLPDDLPAGDFFTWSKQGVGDLDEGRYQGVHCRRLSIPNLQIDDTGTYQCAYNQAKALYTVSIRVVPNLPVLGWGSLLGVALLLPVVIMLKKRRRSIRR